MFILLVLNGSTAFYGILVITKLGAAQDRSNCTCICLAVACNFCMGMISKLIKPYNVLGNGKGTLATLELDYRFNHCTSVLSLCYTLQQRKLNVTWVSLLRFLGTWIPFRSPEVLSFIVHDVRAGFTESKVQSIILQSGKYRRVVDTWKCNSTKWHLLASRRYPSTQRHSRSLVGTCTSWRYVLDTGLRRKYIVNITIMITCALSGSKVINNNHW